MKNSEHLWYEELLHTSLGGDSRNGMFVIITSYQKLSKRLGQSQKFSINFCLQLIPFFVKTDSLEACKCVRWGSSLKYDIFTDYLYSERVFRVCIICYEKVNIIYNIGIFYLIHAYRLYVSAPITQSRSQSAGAKWSFELPHKSCTTKEIRQSFQPCQYLHIAAGFPNSLMLSLQLIALSISVYYFWLIKFINKTVYFDEMFKQRLCQSAIGICNLQKIRFLIQSIAHKHLLLITNYSPPLEHLLPKRHHFNSVHNPRRWWPVPDPRRSA